MKNNNRLLPYLLLNIVISVLATLLVLWWWDRSHRVERPVDRTILTEVVNLVPTASQVASVSYESTLPPLVKPVIDIENVYGVGDLQTEYVQLVRVGEGELDLTGWRIEDEDGNVFVFPNLMLNAGGAVRVYTRAGTDTVIDVYWGMREPVWETYEAITIFDYEGSPRDSLIIP